ncbi:type II/IV secretion system protein [Campylobacter coli]|nr:type II/IV secretion system protein [Campylobacter coli]EMF1317604.1 type II/IV secretion system protein [Campylobacter coli]
MIERFLFEDYINGKITLEQIDREHKIDSEIFLKALASDKNISYSTLEELDLSLGEKFPCSFLFKFKILPILSKENTLHIASSKPCSLELLDEIRIFYEVKNIEVLIASEFKIMKFLYKLQVREKLKNLSTNLRLEWKENRSQDEQSCISQIFDFILDEILEFNPSDIHIEARENDTLIRFRVDGILREFACLEKDIYEALVFHVKFLACLNLAESRKTQDGSFELDFENERYDFRVSCLPLIYGESVVIRILKHDKEILDLYKLNLGNKNLEILKKILHRPNGMILLTGPTGSGKSTTLYACLNELKSIEKKIISAEDPIEYKIPLVQQILLNSKVGVEFNSVLRAILRQDPDIIMIGEIRDEESLDIALKASLTGHLLLSTLHTNDAFSTIDRLLDMQAKSYLIASALSLVIAQRLVRKLCPWCKQKSKKHYIEFEGEFFEPKGCERCHHSGFFGRELIAECLEINEDLSCAIRENQDKTILMELAKKYGFQTMFEQGLKKAKEGLTSIDELLRVVR